MRYLFEFKRPSKPAVFGMLMAGSILVMLLPTDLLAPLRNVAQTVAAPAQMAALRGTQGVSNTVSDITNHPDSTGDRVTAGEHQSLINENIALRDQLTQLKATLAETTGLRKRGFPDYGTLIPARIVSFDAAIGRDSFVVSKGSTSKVRSDDWVVSAMQVNVGKEQGVEDKSAVLARQTLIGWVERTAPLTSRVVLLSDSRTTRPLQTHIAGGDGDHELLTDSNNKLLSFVLYGAGGGKMRLSDIPKEFVSRKWVNKDDYVTSSPEDPRLQMMLVVGRIEKLTLNKAKPVYYDAIVTPVVDVRELGQVLIANLSNTPMETDR